jgi:hypothetical protein
MDDMIFTLNNLVAKRGGIKFEFTPEISGDNFMGGHKPELHNENIIDNAKIIPEEENKDGIIFFIFEWDIRSNGCTLLARVLVTFSFTNKLAVITEKEIMELLENSALQASNFFNKKLAEMPININTPRDFVLSERDRDYVISALNQGYGK